MVMQDLLSLIVNGGSPGHGDDISNDTKENNSNHSDTIPNLNMNINNGITNKSRQSSGRIDNRTRVGSGFKENSDGPRSRSVTPQDMKLKSTPRVDTRASTGMSEFSNDSFILRDSIISRLGSRQNSAPSAGRVDLFANPNSRQSMVEGRLSRSLRQWMPNYEIKSLPPQPYPPRQPLYSARLGNHVRIRRSQSTESIETLLSLFSCSSHESMSRRMHKKKRRKRKKPKDEHLGDGGEGGGKSIWVELASKRRGALDKMLRMHAMYAQLDTESEIYKHLSEEEKILVIDCGYRTGIVLGPGRQRSDSCSNVDKKLPKKKMLQRTQSQGGIHEGPMLDFVDIRRQYINKRLASLQQSRGGRLSGRRSLVHSLSRHSLYSVTSTTPREASPTMQQLLSAREAEEDKKEDELPISIWKGDSQILAIDLKRELTAKVKSKIDTTTSALERATGFGDDNAHRIQVGTLEEYPLLIEEDYSHVAKIPQRVRISPQLSDIIRTDIHVRMGRPRYHEIRTQDLDMWNRGQFLDRSHRNLKVFSWLHSLRESEFDMSLPEAVIDKPPGGNVTTRDEVVVSVDEPKVKPLLERMKHDYIV